MEGQGAEVPTHGQAARATFQSHGQEARATITVCLPEVDVSAYNLPWRRWATENGAMLVFSPQGATRIDPDQNKEFWRTLLFNADYPGCKKHAWNQED
jgi:hypothetical protein